jgi:prophage maintenance system killer protein
MGIESNIQNPVGMEQWRQIAHAGDTMRVVLNGSGGVHGQDVPQTAPDYAVQNQQAFDNLFSALHGAGHSDQAMGVLRDLLERTRDSGLPLTGALVHQALHVANDFAPPDCVALCRKWDVIGQTDVLSPRTDLGYAFHDELDIVMMNRLIAQFGADAQPGQMRQGLEEMISQLRDAQGIGPEIREKTDSVLRMRLEQVRFGERAGQLAHTALGKLDDAASDAYKLVMDGKHHAYGAAYFENERGYMAGMLSALNLMLDEVTQPLTADSYLALHDTAVAGVHKRDQMGTGSLFQQGYRDNEGVMFGLGLSNWSVEGRLEFEASAKASDPHAWVKIMPHPEQPVDYVVAQAKPAQQCRDKAAAIIQTYHDELALAQDEEGKLACIAKCCQDLDQHHLFADGNIRTAAFLTLNKLLLQNDMSPALFEDPNVLDMHSIKEIVDFIRAGQALYGALLST